MKILSKEENFKNLVEASIEKFGDIFIFDINEYVTKANITIRCKNGHVLNRTHKNHLNSKGCQYCVQRMTQEEFIHKSKEIHGDKFDYSLVIFTGVNKKVELVCNDCGDHIHQTPSNNLMGNSCMRCSRRKPHTTETFVDMITKIHGDKFGYHAVDYVNMSTKVKLWCNNCQKYIYKDPRNLLYSGCLTCSGKETLTQEEFLRRSIEAHGNLYDYSNAIYVSMDTKVEIKCLRCGHIFQIDPKHHIHRNQGCSICERNSRSERRPSRREEYIQRCVNQHGNKYDYSLIPENVKISDSVKIFCKECGKYFEQTLNVHVRSVIGCQKCAGLEKLTQEEFIRKAIEVHGDNYNYSKFVVSGVDNKSIIICNKCRKEFLMSPYDHVSNNRGCPRHNKSRGERKIERFLVVNDIYYKSQKTFKDCKNIIVLPFDFAILNNDGSVKGLVEFHGAQHYRSVCFGGMSIEKAEENFKNLQVRDSIKKEYCQKNGIQLLEIHYKDYKNIPIILSQFIRSLDDLLEAL